LEAAGALPFEGARSAQKKYNIMNTIIKFGLAALTAGAFSTLPSKADRPDIFTQHDIPVPGAFFKNKESQQPATVAVSESGKGVGKQKQTISTSGKKHTKHVRPTNSGS
jgi:hypothetical protein